jgi:hypothetical protein
LDDQEPPEEWDFITFDTEETCSVCQQLIHAGQAVGYVKGLPIHAKCYKKTGQPS